VLRIPLTVFASLGYSPASMAHNAAIEPFVELAKTTSGPLALCGVIDRCLRSRDVFVFGELLDLPQVQSLASTAAYQAHFSTLNLFAYGTYQDYKSAKAAGTYLDLPEAVIRKLKQLTLLSIAATRKTLTYAELEHELEVPNTKELEDTIISTMYAGLISGKLDQRNQLLEIHTASGRDVRPDAEAVDSLLQRVSEWRHACVMALASIEREVDLHATTEEVAKQHKQEFEHRVCNAQMPLPSITYVHAFVLQFLDAKRAAEREPRNNASSLGGIGAEQPGAQNKLVSGVGIVSQSITVACRLDRYDDALWRRALRHGDG
jgi:COP9 signalosome complex subunit 7